MGCIQSKSKTGDTSSKEDTSQGFGEITKIKHVDSRLPLDARQAFKLKQSWKGVKRKIEEAGIEMFIR